MPTHQPLFFSIPSTFTWKNFQLAELLSSLLKKTKDVWSDAFGCLQAKPPFPNRNMRGGQSPQISAFFTFRFMSWHPTRTASNTSLITKENLGILLMTYFDAFSNMKLQRTSLPRERDDRQINEWVLSKSTKWKVPGVWPLCPRSTPKEPCHTSRRPEVSPTPGFKSNV